MILRVDNAGCGPSPGMADTVHYLFYVRNMFFVGKWVLAGFGLFRPAPGKWGWPLSMPAGPSWKL